jgi:uncharacterized coiled-coil protein SlyX
MHKINIVVITLLSAILPVAAQVSAPSKNVPQQTASNQSQMISSQANTAWLTKLEENAMKTVADLSQIRVSKWKTDSRDKDQMKDNIESLQRNLSDALPVLIQAVRTNPQSLSPSFKLYHNLNAVYDVLSSVTESTGAFGSKDEYSALAQDIASLDIIRRNLADQLEKMATAQDALVTHLSTMVKTQQEQAAESAPPKRIIVDDNLPAKKKPTKAKPKPAAKTPTPQ